MLSFIGFPLWCLAPGFIVVSEDYWSFFDCLLTKFGCAGLSPFGFRRLSLLGLFRRLWSRYLKTVLEIILSEYLGGKA